MSRTSKINPATLVNELVRRVNVQTESVSGKGENTTWTKAVKDALAEIGSEEDRNYDSVFTSREKSVAEFMVDFVWWDRSDGEGAALAVECEWFYGRFRREDAYAAAVSEDFWKLLCFKAPLKLVIFASMEDRRTKHDIQQKVKQSIESCLQKYKDHVAGEIYIALDFVKPTKAWIVEIPENFDRTQLSFSELEITSEKKKERR